MKVEDIVLTSIGLTASPQSQASFTKSILLVDHADIPIDRRYRSFTKTSYPTGVTASTEHLGWLTTLWSQNYNPAIAYLGRWVSAASSPYMYCTSAAYTAYTGISDGTLTVVDSDANEDDITALDFQSCTSLANVATVIETAIQAVGTPNITGLGSVTCTVDILDRIMITHASVTGASAITLSIKPQGTGTDVTGSSYLGTETVQAGLDAETLGAAQAAIIALNNDPFIWCQRGADIAQGLAFSTASNALSKICIILDDDANAKDSNETSDVGYQIEALSHQKTFLAYSEHTTANGATANQNADAAICGEIMPQIEAKVHWGQTALLGLSESGLDADKTTTKEMTSDEASALTAKGYDFLTKPAGSTHFTHGLAAGGNEIRVMIGKLYCESRISVGVYGYLLAQPVVTYSDTDIAAIKSIIIRWLDIMVERKVLEAGYVLTMPSAADFTAATKATHEMVLSDLTDADTQRVVNTITISLTWAV